MPPVVVVTTTLCGPATFAGVVALMVVPVTVPTVARAMVTNVEPGTKLVPVMVTGWLPVNGPVTGKMVATLGPALKV